MLTLKVEIHSAKTFEPEVTYKPIILRTIGVELMYHDLTDCFEAVVDVLAFKWLHSGKLKLPRSGSYFSREITIHIELL